MRRAPGRWLTRGDAHLGPHQWLKICRPGLTTPSVLVTLGPDALPLHFHLRAALRRRRRRRPPPVDVRRGARELGLPSRPFWSPGRLAFGARGSKKEGRARELV